MRIAVIGAGGVGGWLAARLGASGVDVHVVARGRQLAAIREQGLTLRSVAGDAHAMVHATAEAGEIGPCNVVLFCVKSYDTDEAAATHLPALTTSETAVVTLQNGIDNPERIARVVGRPQVVGGLALIASTVTAPGLVSHTGGPARIVFGELDGGSSARTSALAKVCTDAAIDAQVSDCIDVAMWDKFAFLCALAGTTATVRLPLGDIRACAASWSLFGRIVEEVYAVARAEGVQVPDDAVEKQIVFAEGLEPHLSSSLYHDLVTGRRMELEALHGTVLRRGQEVGVPTPMCEAVYAVLHPHADIAGSTEPPGH
jgi:2-dehydropantoate 2-reductase